MRGTYVAKVAREDIKSHGRSTLVDWDGCQDREESDDVSDAETATDDKLEADRLGKTAVRAQCRQQASPENGENPASIYCHQVFARFLDCYARHDCDEADAVRQPKKVDTGTRGCLVLACFEEDRIPI